MDNNSQHRIYQTSLIIHLYFNSHFTKNSYWKKNCILICISLPFQKNIEKKTNPLQIMEIPCILSELSILLLLLYKCVYCTWRKENAVKIQNNFEFWNKKTKTTTSCIYWTHITNIWNRCCVALKFNRFSSFVQNGSAQYGLSESCFLQ